MFSLYRIICFRKCHIQHQVLFSFTSNVFDRTHFSTRFRFNGHITKSIRAFSNPSFWQITLQSHCQKHSQVRVKFETPQFSHLSQRLINHSTLSSSPKNVVLEVFLAQNAGEMQWVIRGGTEGRKNNFQFRFGEIGEPASLFSNRKVKKSRKWSEWQIECGVGKNIERNVILGKIFYLSIFTGFPSCSRICRLEKMT